MNGMWMKPADGSTGSTSGTRVAYATGRTTAAPARSVGPGYASVRYMAQPTDAAAACAWSPPWPSAVSRSSAANCASSLGRATSSV